VRFKCVHPGAGCADFDLCARCEALPIPVHPPAHPLLKMRAPDAAVPRVLREGERVLREGERAIRADERVLSEGERVLLPGERVLLPGERVLLPGERVLLPGERVLLPGERVLRPGERVAPPLIGILPHPAPWPPAVLSSRMLSPELPPAPAPRPLSPPIFTPPAPAMSLMTRPSPSPLHRAPVPYALTTSSYTPYTPPYMPPSPPYATMPRLPSPPSFLPTAEPERFPYFDGFVRTMMPGGLPPSPPSHLPSFPPSPPPPTFMSNPVFDFALGGIPYSPAAPHAPSVDFSAHGGASVPSTCAESPQFFTTPPHLDAPLTFAPPPAPFFPPASSFSPSTASPATPAEDLPGQHAPEFSPPASSFPPSVASPVSSTHDLPAQQAFDFFPPAATREHDEPLVSLASSSVRLIDLTQSSSESQSRGEPTAEFVSLEGSGEVRHAEDEPLAASHRTEGEFGPMLPHVPQTDLHELSDLAAHFRHLWAQGSAGGHTPKTDSPAKPASEAVSVVSPPTELASSTRSEDDALSASRIEEAWGLKERTGAESQPDAYTAAVAKYTRAATGGLFRLSQALEMVQSAEASRAQTIDSPSAAHSIDSPSAAHSPLSAVELLSTPRRPLARSNLFGTRTLADLFGGAGSLRVTPATAPSTSTATTSRPTTLLSTSSRPTSTFTDDTSTVVGVAQPDALRAAYVADNNIPDGQVFPPGAEFVKSWAMRNDGTVAWPETTELVFVAGDRLQIEGLSGDRFKVGSVEPGAEVDIWTGEMKAPDAPGKYISYWRLSDGKGNRFGHSIWVECVPVSFA
jgi:hypothetical protein